MNLYLAFKPLNKNETIIYAGRQVGLLRKFSTDGNVKKAFDLLRPIISHVAQQPIGKRLNKRRGARQVYTYYPIGTNLINGLATWQTANVPSLDQIQPGLPPIRPKMKAVFVGPPNGNGKKSQ